MNSGVLLKVQEYGGTATCDSTQCGTGAPHANSGSHYSQTCAAGKTTISGPPCACVIIVRTERTEHAV